MTGVDMDSWAIGVIAGLLSGGVSVVTMIYTFGSRIGQLAAQLHMLQRDVEASQHAVDQAYKAQINFNGDMREFTARIEAEHRALRERMQRMEEASRA